MAYAVEAYFSDVARLMQIVRPKLRIDYRDCEVNLTSSAVGAKCLVQLSSAAIDAGVRDGNTAREVRSVTECSRSI